jgi:hypothetical protein
MNLSALSKDKSDEEYALAVREKITSHEISLSLAKNINAPTI